MRNDLPPQCTFSHILTCNSYRFASSAVATPVEISALIILPCLFKIAKEPELSSLALKLTAGG